MYYILGDKKGNDIEANVNTVLDGGSGHTQGWE